MSINESIISSRGIPGSYTREERMNKILKYKNKIRKWRSNHPLARNFKGRSAVAGKKPRVKGKFVTLEEYQKYLALRNGEKSHSPVSIQTASQVHSQNGEDCGLKEENR